MLQLLCQQLPPRVPVASRQACEIRLRAERKCGELLSGDIERAGRGRPAKMSGDTTLSDLHISRDQSSDWQRLAAIPDDEFEAALATEETPTTAGVLRAHTEPQSQHMDNRALWVWGRLQDFEREGILDENPSELFDAMLAGVRDPAPS
jgi:hypothetical protein